MPNLKPFRDYSEHDVISLYAFSGAASVNKGTLVTPVQSWSNVDGPFNISGTYGSNSENGPTNLFNPLNGSIYGAYSTRFDGLGQVQVAPQVSTTGVLVAAPIGITLKDIREFDENGEKLIYNPRKKAELDAVLPNEIVPILTRGTVFINDIDQTAGFAQPGDAAYSGPTGTISTYGIFVVGRFLTSVGPDGYALIKLNIA
jgi:hypothetical protein